MHKRSEISDGIWVVLSAIIAVVGLLLLFPLIGETKEVTESLTDYQICKDGNLLKAKNKIKAIDWINKEEGVNHCTTQQVLVPKDKEYETITKNMALCKDQFLLGTEEVFPSKDANYCAFCSVLEFEDQSKKKEQQLSKMEQSLSLKEKELEISRKTLNEQVAEKVKLGKEKNILSESHIMTSF